MKKNTIFILLVLCLFGSASLFGQNKKSFSEKVAEVTVVEGEDYSIELPASWNVNTLGQDMGGMVVEFMAIADDGATNVILQTTSGEIGDMSESDFLYAMSSMINAMADELTILAQSDNRLCYCVEIQGNLVVQDLYCAFVGDKIFVFAASTAMDSYEYYSSIFDEIYESFEILTD